MSTALDLIKEAGKEICVFSEGLTPNAEQANDALIKLNRVIDDLNSQNLALYNTTNVTSTLIANQNPHTVGIGGNINIERPLKIQRAFTRQPGALYRVDYMMDQFDNDQYQEFIVKSINTSYPTHFYYDCNFPLANFYTYPVQSQTLELHLSVWSKLTKFILTTDISLPEPYEEILMLKLALKMAPSYGVNLDKIKIISDEAARMIRNIKAINQDSNHMILDYALVSGKGSFNILRGF
jgi:hypothetical protein